MDLVWYEREYDVPMYPTLQYKTMNHDQKRATKMFVFFGGGAVFLVGGLFFVGVVALAVTGCTVFITIGTHRL